MKKAIYHPLGWLSLFTCNKAHKMHDGRRNIRERRKTQRVPSCLLSWHLQQELIQLRNCSTLHAGLSDLHAARWHHATCTCSLTSA